jgi:hypothetical protein
MPNTHDVGPFFFHGIRLRPRTALIHRASTEELDPPFRTSKSVVFRFFRWGVVLGRWRVTERTEEEAWEALGGKQDYLTTESIRQTYRFDHRYREEQRAKAEAFVYPHNPDDDDDLVA